MNPKIFVGAAVAVLGAIIISILAVGPAMVADIPTLQAPSQQPANQILPIVISLESVEVTKISERSATVEVSLELHNPNARSVIVQTLDYRLFETGHDDDPGAISGGQIGTRPEGMVEFGSNYYTLLAGGTITLRDSSVIPNSGNEALWEALQAGTASWRVTGDAFYNLSSMTSGQENEASFDLAYP